MIEPSGSGAPYTVHWSCEQMLRDVRDGLRQSPKQLPSKYFYDDRGSELFEQITDLPEYYLTRAERALLEHSIPYVVARLRPGSLVELGAGSANKTRIILDAMRDLGEAKCYVPIDVSADFLEAVAAQLRREYPQMEIAPVVSDISESFRLPKLASPVLIVFLGSTLGNFSSDTAVELLSRVAAMLGPADAFLLGIDLRKDPAVLHAAYNDSQGVTAAFNLNILNRLNRELGANFPLEQFDHSAFYSMEHHRIEMHLVARSGFSVTVPGIGEVQFAAGESIRTELSHKYDPKTVEDMLADSGMRLERWIPDDAGVFALALARAAG
jgi:L-histidine N-alpha-methyltransferase